VDLPRSAWVFENLNTIKITPPPQADVVIFRCTDVAQPKAEFFPGNSIKAEDLNANQKQVLNAIEELRCTIANLEIPENNDGTCSDTGDCAGGEICYDGQCVQVCDETADCPPGFACYGGVCLPLCDANGNCPEGSECYDGICVPTCDETSDCPDGTVCYGGVCIPECDVDEECPDGQECYEGVCLISCDVDTDCPEGKVCYDGVCLDPCDEEGNCDEGFICQDGVCVPNPIIDAPADNQLYGRQDGEWELAVPYDYTLLPEILPPNERTGPQNLNPLNRAGVDINDAPSDGNLYGRINENWAPAILYDFTLLPTYPEEEVDPASTTSQRNPNVRPTEITEAPTDGQMYGRKDAAWSDALQYNIAELPSFTQQPDGSGEGENPS
jgi:hypothetical protein